jgi:hypothetical protein
LLVAVKQPEGETEYVLDTVPPKGNDWSVKAGVKTIYASQLGEFKGSLDCVCTVPIASHYIE